MGSCTRFTVHGLYWYLDGAFLNQPKPLSREQHLAALAYLQDDASSKPCVVQSRALLLEDETTAGRAVLSFHNAI